MFDDRSAFYATKKGTTLKVGFVASTYPRFEGDGAGRFVQSIADALAALGHEVHVLAPYHPSVRPVESPIQIHHFRYIWPDALAIMGYAQAMDSDRSLHKLAYLLSPLYFLSGFIHLMWIARRYKIDVLHAHWVIPNAPIAALVAKFLHLPLVISLHGSDVFFAQKQFLLRRIAKWAFSRAVATTACSPDLLEGALEIGAPKAKTHLLIWGADPNVFDQVVDAMHVRSQWGIHPSEGVVLSLGRLVKKKGLQYLLQAIPRVLERVPNTRFVIAGSGPELDALREQADQLSVLEQVVFPGEVRWNDVPNVLKMCDIFVVPSVHDENGNVDGLPTTILEAMAAGRPVVASNVAGIPLAVIDRETGMLVDEANSMQLAEAITELLLSPDLAKEYGLAGRARVEAELNWNSVARKFVEFYNLGCDVS